jgi:hypothetical protein
VVYLASFGNLIKVGMTSASRLRERAIEQGRMRCGRCSNAGPQEARSLEKETSRRFKIPRRFRYRGWRGPDLPPSRER